MGAVDGECLRARVFETEGARERVCVSESEGFGEVFRNEVIQ